MYTRSPGRQKVDRKSFKKTLEHIENTIRNHYNLKNMSSRIEQDEK